MIVLYAGERVDRIEPMRDEPRDDRLRGGHLRHDLALLTALRSLADHSVSVEGWCPPFALTNGTLHAPFRALFPTVRRPIQCIATDPIPAALCATATSAKPCGSPAGCIACAIMAACCSSTCAIIMG